MRRSAIEPGFHAGRPPRNKGMRYPADPPTVEEILAVMRVAGETIHGRRLRALIVLLWRAGLRINEALALSEPDLDPRRGAVLVRRGKGARLREVRIDDWAREHLQPWMTARLELPVGPLLCILTGPTRGRRWSISAARTQLRATAAAAVCAGASPRTNLRHAHAVELALVVIQRQLGHSNLGITSVYRQGIDNAEIIEAVHARPAPMVPVHVELRR